MVESSIELRSSRVAVDHSEEVGLRVRRAGVVILGAFSAAALAEVVSRDPFISSLIHRIGNTENFKLGLELTAAMFGGFITNAASGEGSQNE